MIRESLKQRGYLFSSSEFHELHVIKDTITKVTDLQVYFEI